MISRVQQVKLTCSRDFALLYFLTTFTIPRFPKLLEECRLAVLCAAAAADMAANCSAVGTDQQPGGEK
jgi:hypothetical protein